MLNRTALIRSICERRELSTDDPYDIWKTSLGFRVKDFYNRHRMLGLAPGAVLALFDMYLNNRFRFFYHRQEYPIVRAMAAQALLRLYAQSRDEKLLSGARMHLDWLHDNTCTGYSGPCWGLGFRYAVDRGLIYQPNTPLTTMTPYALEAYVHYSAISTKPDYRPVIRGIYEFMENDVPVVEETEDHLVTAYSDIADRKVINAVSYMMFSYSLLLAFLEPGVKEEAARKIRKLYNYVKYMQRPDGSWPYSTASSTFVDCFHSCIVIKNIVKTAQRFQLDGWEKVSTDGYKFLLNEMQDQRSGLFRRFSKANKPGLIRFDLYDNAEMLNLAYLMGDANLVESLSENIKGAFVRGDRIYSQIDWLGIRRGPDMLRWAIMPYLYALAVTETSATAETVVPRPVPCRLSAT